MRIRLVALCVALAILLLVADPPGMAATKQFSILVSTYAPIDQFISAQNTMIKWYAEDHGIKTYWAPTDINAGGETQVKNAMGILGTAHVDGILLCSPEAKPEKVITDYAKTHNIPVVGFQELTDSPDLLLYVGTLPGIQGQMGGEAMKRALKEKFGQVKGKVLVVDTTPASVTHHARTLGFLSVLKDQPNVKIDRLEVRNITTESTKEIVNSYLALGKTFDAAWGPSGAMPKGIVAALQSYPGASPKDEIIIGSEAYTTILQGMRDGYVKAITAPAAQYIGVVGFQYLIDYLNGKPLPKVGATVSSFSIPGGKARKGFNPWRSDYIKEALLPAKVISLQAALRDYPDLKKLYQYDYPVWSINVPVVTTKNVNAPWVWGNFPYDWAVEVR